MATDDPFDLERFVEAQEGVYPRALAELRSGRKRSHWMWFVFPQVAGLGFSPMAQRYAISGREEAQSYLAHTTLGLRLVESCEAVLGVQGRTAHEILGSPDDLKLHSCVTLFAAVAAPGSVFGRVLEKYYAGVPDRMTLEQLQGGKRGDQEGAT